MSNLPSSTPVVNSIRFVDVSLQPDASAALRSTLTLYFSWLKLVDPALWLTTAICYQQFALDAAGIGEDDTIAMFLDSAPMLNHFFVETAYAARSAVLAAKS